MVYLFKTPSPKAGRSVRFAPSPVKSVARLLPVGPTSYCNLKSTVGQYSRTDPKRILSATKKRRYQYDGRTGAGIIGEGTFYELLIKLYKIEYYAEDPNTKQLFDYLYIPVRTQDGFWKAATYLNSDLTMCSDLGEGSRCCAFYSAVGTLFTLWVGILISQQPFFIAGIEDAQEAKKNAFGAMGMFAVTFLVSLAGIWYDSNYKKDPAVSDEAAEGYQLSAGDVPTYGTSA